MTTESPKELQTTSDINVPNIRAIQNKKNIFVCRTQAGFNQALKKFRSDPEKFEVRGFPTSYPCLVVLTWEEDRGRLYIRCNELHMSVLRNIVEQDSQDTNLLLTQSSQNARTE